MSLPCTDGNKEPRTSILIGGDHSSQTHPEVVPFFGGTIRDSCLDLKDKLVAQLKVMYYTWRNNLKYLATTKENTEDWTHSNTNVT